MICTETISAPALDPVAARWREVFLETLRPFADDRHPLLLSGGVDSATILAGLLTLGVRPRCYAFRLGETDSGDVQTARRMCADFDLALDVATIPKTDRQLIEDVIRTIRLLRTARKAAVQCAQPIMWMARRIARDGYDKAIVGTGAVCLDDKRVYLLLASGGEEAAREYRRAKLNDRNLPVGTGYMHRMARLFGVVLEEPYSDEPLRSHALALDMAELNAPRQKGIACRAFPDFWNRPGYYRRNSPLQVNSGVREWHDRLLRMPGQNPTGARSVVAIYNRIAREVLREPTLA